MTDAKIRVLVVDDSPTVREMLVETFNAEADMEVVATARNGREAVSAVLNARPDIVTMDVAMPEESGLDATRRIMSECPLPIVVVSSTLETPASARVRALDAGALAFVATPAAGSERTAELVETVRLMAEVRVVRRWRSMNPVETDTVSIAEPTRRQIQLIAIGASTGGPQAILAVLDALPSTLPVPVLIVQHIAEGFVDDFVGWLAGATHHPVKVAIDGETVLPGHVYVAPDQSHMGVTWGGRVLLIDAPAENGLRPSVAHLFRSVRDAYGARAAAVLLSGMGSDGARELLELKQAGALTFAQDRGTAPIFGMPGAAVKLSAACFILEPAKIGAALSAAAHRDPEIG